MKDFLLNVEDLYEAGLSIEEIAKRLGVDVPLVESAFKWITEQRTMPQSDDE